jgi:Protein of unknown function (DUF4038)/Domain of unknown function (DUF5060)
MTNSICKFTFQVATAFAIVWAARAMPSLAAPANVSFSPSPATIEAYDFVEVTLNVAGPDAQNPFTDVEVRGQFGKTGESKRLAVEGFCDSQDGSVFRVRFMPWAAGNYDYSISYRQGTYEKTQAGSFQATDGHRRGMIRVDPAYPWHFIWEGTGEHYFFNGTTAFWLMGWRDERTIDFTIERLHRLKINRMRVLLAGSANIFWGEPVMTGENFTYALRPWLAENPESWEHPGIDYAHFNIPYWQKYERMLRYARDRDMIISVIQDISTHKAQPTPYSDDERRYLRYMVARLSAFCNITYDLGDDMDSFRDEKWVHATGKLIEDWDPYKHLATSHPVHREHQDRASPWFGFTSIQNWSHEQHALMLQEREIQKKTGRIIPQTNEEYGYEDHYPHWAPAPPLESADTLRQLAWDIAMAGAYGTAGESCRRGTNIWPNTGGGWINGRGDDTMVMLKGYEHMVDFFTSFEWWKTEPHDELVSKPAYCLAKPGEIYAVYIPLRPLCVNVEHFGYESECGDITIQLEPGTYNAHWFSASSGEIVPLPQVHGPSWKIPEPPGWLDWALLLEKAK